MPELPEQSCPGHQTHHNATSKRRKNRRAFRVICDDGIEAFSEEALHESLKAREDSKFFWEFVEFRFRRSSTY
jgi:hypothetical protein